VRINDLRTEPLLLGNLRCGYLIMSLPQITLPICYSYTSPR